MNEIDKMRDQLEDSPIGNSRLDKAMRVLMGHITERGDDETVVAAHAVTEAYTNVQATLLALVELEVLTDKDIEEEQS